ncbi:hypothetical protein V6N13_088785 [Hibiscus sabdariffa]|uniref:Cytochrome P450 n=1 Tax=Hibiscus sabdariffa TaxID=183260 RepID=A0ABR2G147_9ROSI
METWFFVVLTITISLILKAIFNLFSPSKKLTHSLPPGPFTFPVIGNILWLTKSFFQIEPILRNLRKKYGPMVTLHIGSRPSIFVFDRSLTHQALVQSGALYSDRPKALPTSKIVTSNQHNISSAPYGPNWRVLRRNLTSEILHTSRIKSYSHARKWVLDILFGELQSKAKTGESVQVLTHFQYAMFWVVGNGGEIKEDDLQKMPYLKAVILEGLRRHPPGHFVLPHSVNEDTVLGDYLVPKNGTINFMVAEMGWDPKLWEDPMAFKPERFLKSKDGSGEVIDITGSREIKMMPFGAGRRICPGLGLALLHLEYFVPNLVWRFEWKGVDGDEISLEEKQEFTVVMKNPLMAHISPRKI